MDTRGTVRMGCRVRMHVCLGFFTTQAKFGSTIVLIMSRWSGKTSSGTVNLVVWLWFQPKLHSGRTRVDPVHGSSDWYVRMGEPRLNFSERPDLHAELVPWTDPWTGAHHHWYINFAVVSVLPSVVSAPLYRRQLLSVPLRRPRSVAVCAHASSSIRCRMRLCIVLDPSSSLYLIISCLRSDQVFCVCGQWSSKESFHWEFNVDKNRNASFIYIDEDLQYEDLMKMVSKNFGFKEEEISLSYRILVDLKRIVKVSPTPPPPPISIGNTRQLRSFIGEIRAFDKICRLCGKFVVITDSASCTKQTTNTFASHVPLTDIPVLGSIVHREKHVITDSASCNKKTTDTLASTDTFAYPAPLNAIPVFASNQMILLNLATKPPLLRN
ncbi:LOW QUALITY PROTEIN: hypothetical protein YC2023_011778 [Brassica napus]